MDSLNSSEHLCTAATVTPHTMSSKTVGKLRFRRLQKVKSLRTPISPFSAQLSSARVCSRSACESRSSRDCVGPFGCHRTSCRSEALAATHRSAIQREAFRELRPLWICVGCSGPLCEQHKEMEAWQHFLSLLSTIPCLSLV